LISKITQELSPIHPLDCNLNDFPSCEPSPTGGDDDDDDDDEDEDIEEVRVKDMKRRTVLISISVHIRQLFPIYISSWK
jgi:hypothetical protein